MLFRKAVTVRHTILAAGAVLVLGMVIYLFREVSRTPSTAQARNEPREVTTPTPPPQPPMKSSDPPTKAAIPMPPSKPSEEDPIRVDEPPAHPTQDVPPPDKAEIIPTRANPKLDAIMGEANRAYDHGDFDEAKQIAVKVLEKNPGNVRMLRIVVSAECIAGDSAEAQKYFTQLPEADRAQMRTRCDRYGVTLKDP